MVGRGLSSGPGRKWCEMTEQEALEFCEKTECEDCPVVLENLDRRTKFDRAVGQVPCFENLVKDGN